MKKNKGFAPVLVMGIVLGVLVVGGVAYYAGKSSNPASQNVQENNNTNSSVVNSNTSFITILSPNGGEEWAKGEKVKISWTSSKDIKLVNIGLSILNDDPNGGQTFSADIITNIPNTGNYEWTVQELYSKLWGIKDLPVSNKYSVIIIDSEHNNVWDKSDKSFKIISSSTTTEVLKNQPAFLISAYSKNGKNYIDVDYVEWLSGAASIKAQVEDGQCVSVSECYDYPNGYKRNQNPLIRTFEVNANASIQIAGFFSCTKFNGCGQSGMVSFDEFKNLAAQLVYPNKVNPSFKQPKTFVTIDIQNNKVTNIVEPYQE